MVFVEGDASINTYQDANGQTRSSLNVVQRACPSAPSRTPRVPY